MWHGMEREATNYQRIGIRIDVVMTGGLYGALSVTSNRKGGIKEERLK